MHELRGQCYQISKEASENNKELKLVRGYYHCPFWGKQQHWWNVDAEGNIIDLTKDQFPSKGHGSYEVYDGILECESCGKKIKEEEVTWAGRYPVCDNVCYGRLVL